MNIFILLAAFLLVYLLEDRLHLRLKYRKNTKRFGISFNILMLGLMVILEIGFVFLTWGYISEALRLLTCLVTFVYGTYIIAPPFRREDNQ